MTTTPSVRGRAAALLLAALAACGDEPAPAAPPAAATTPPAAAAPAASPHADPHSAHAAAAAHDDSLRGTVQLDPALGLDASAYAALFVMGRRSPGGPVLLVQKLDRPAFPASFELHGDALHTAGPSGWHVDARLDRDGDAVSQAGDVTAAAVAIPAQGGRVELRLDRVVPGTQSPALLPAGAAPVTAAPPAAAAGEEEEDEDEAAGPALDPRFAGTIELAPEFADLDGKHILFIMLRSPQTAGGMPLAVKRIDRATFPVSFDLGAEAVPLDVDNKAEMIAGDVRIVVRLSLSGKLTGGPGDLETELTTRPATGLKLRLDTRRTQ